MLPRVIIHSAVSVDGRIDWFTPDIGLYYELAAQWGEHATLAGSNTIISAEEANMDEGDPTPFEVDPTDTRPLLVVPDSRGRIQHWGVLREQPYWRQCVVLVSKSTPKSYLEYLKEWSIDTIMTGDTQVDLRKALEILYERYDVKVVRVDSGGTLNGVLLRAGLVNEVSVMIHPGLVGGISPRSLFRAPDLSEPEGVIPLSLTHVEELRGDVVWLRYDVVG